MSARYGCLIIGLVAAFLFLAMLIGCRLTGIPIAEDGLAQRNGEPGALSRELEDAYEPAALIDTNVPIYAVGRPHSLKEPWVEILMLVAERPLAFITDAEVLKELLHRYLAPKLWPQGREVFRQFSVLMHERVQPVRAGDVQLAAELADAPREMGGRDLLHAAVMRRLGVNQIITADAGFDRLPGLVRLDPGQIAAWRHTVLGSP